MILSFITKYKPAIILTLALAVFLASCKLPTTTTPGKSWVVSTFVGNGTEGYNTANAIGIGAQFRGPYDMAVDSADNVYVADYGNHCIRKITPEGVVSTFAGSRTAGFADTDTDNNVVAQFRNPTDVAVDSSGNLYVADYGNHRIRKIDTTTREVTTLAGSTRGYEEGTGTAAKFDKPHSVAVDSDGNVYVADYGNHRIRKITSGGDVTTLAGNGEAGFANGAGATAQFNGSLGVAVDSSDNVYVADVRNHRIRKIDTTTREVTTFAGIGIAGLANGAGTVARFDRPYSVAVDSSDNVYVVDTGNHCIRKITPGGGEVTTLAGNGEADFENGAGTAAQFDNPTGVVVDSSGILYVADKGNNRIRKIEYK